MLIGVFAGAGALLAPGWVREISTIATFAAVAAIVGEILVGFGDAKRRSPSIFEEALRTRPPTRARPADLEALERAFGWRTYSGPEYDHRVRPILRYFAVRRLGTNQPSERLARLVGEHQTSESVRTQEIAYTVSEIEGL